jgi:hypothetical protein
MAVEIMHRPAQRRYIPYLLYGISLVGYCFEREPIASAIDYKSNPQKLKAQVTYFERLLQQELCKL